MSPAEIAATRDDDFLEGLLFALEYPFAAQAILDEVAPPEKAARLATSATALRAGITL